MTFVYGLSLCLRALVFTNPLTLCPHLRNKLWGRIHDASNLVAVCRAFPVSDSLRHRHRRRAKGAVRSRANRPECEFYPRSATAIAPAVPALLRRSAQAGPFPSDQFRLSETISGAVQFPGSAFGNRTGSGILPGAGAAFCGKLSPGSDLSGA